MRLVLYPVFAGVMLFGLPASAAPQHLSELVQMTLKDDEMRFAKTRSELVDAAERYCNGVKNVFPTNSPAENKWLSEEIKVSGPRVERAAQSAEFGRKIASNFTTQCLAATDAYKVNGLKKNALILLAISFANYHRLLPDAATKNGISATEWGFGGMSIIVPTVLKAALQEP